MSFGGSADQTGLSKACAESTAAGGQGWVLFGKTWTFRNPEK